MVFGFLTNSLVSPFATGASPQSTEAQAPAWAS